jgi:hypothetical protein
MFVVTPFTRAQHVHPAGPAAPGTQATSTLTAEQVRQLLDGEGMGMARPAESNHYPGPKHVLELGSELALTADQQRRVAEVRDRMLADAKRLGREIVDAERALDAAFAARTITPRDLDERTAAIATLNGRLRAVHLAAHLSTAPMLTAEQIKQYDLLRGRAR